MKVSNCCGATFVGETDLCSKCKEHAGEYEAVEFTCTKCGSHRLEEVMAGVTVSSIVHTLAIEDGEVSMEYGEQSNEGGTVDRYQCMDCGDMVANSQEELIEELSGQFHKSVIGYSQQLRSNHERPND